MYRRQIGYLIGVVILLAWVSLTPAATVSEEAQRYMARGMAAVEMAQSASDYALAAKEYEQAAKLAPDWPDIYYNLGSVQSKAGDIPSAIKSFQRYLDLAPKSPDAAKVRGEIFKLEYRLEREKLATTLEGTWKGPDGQTFKMKLDGARFQLTRGRVGDDILVQNVMFQSYTSPMGDVPLVFSGTLVGDKISGQYLQAAGKANHCIMPERKGDFEGTVDVAARQMRIVYNRATLKYEWEFRSMLSDEVDCRQIDRKETPGYVLELKKQPLPGSASVSQNASVPSPPTGAYKGVRSYANGDKYEGAFLNGKIHGKGIYSYANGDKYEGVFANGKFTSKGTFTCSNGNRFTGNLEGKEALGLTLTCD
jgi:Tetratricopeptide repeat/MORN repeat